jgi:hypothetical protein
MSGGHGAAGQTPVEHLDDPIRARCDALWWSPEIGIGIAVLTNSQDHQLKDELAVSILADVLREPGAYRDRMLSLPWRAAVEDPNLSFDPPAPMATLIADAAMKASGDRASRWAGYTGLYRAPEWDVVNPEGHPDRFVVDAGVCAVTRRARCVSALVQATRQQGDRTSRERDTCNERADGMSRTQRRNRPGRSRDMTHAPSAGRVG